MGVGEGAIAAAALAQRLVGVLDVGDSRECFAQAFEALDEERVDDSVLRVEVVVDAHRGHARRSGNPAHGESVGAFRLENVSRRREERIADLPLGVRFLVPAGASALLPALRPGPAPASFLVRGLSGIGSSLLKNTVL